MFRSSNIIIRTEFYPIEIEKLIEDNMALVFANFISLFSSCVSVDGIVISLLHHNCSRNLSCCGRPEARSDMRACACSLSNKQKKARDFHISVNVLFKQHNHTN